MNGLAIGGAVAGMMIGRWLGPYVVKKSVRWQASLDKRPLLTTVLKVATWAIIIPIGLAAIIGLVWLLTHTSSANLLKLLAIFAVAGLVGLVGLAISHVAERLKARVREG